MRRAILVTDLTRMQEGRVCIAGYDDQGTCIRPVLPPPGIYESALYANGCLIVCQGSVVEFNLLAPIPDPPHTEDVLFYPRSLRFVRRIDEAERRRVLERTCFSSVEAIFETPIQEGPGFYVMQGQGCRSLGTVRPHELGWLRYSPDSGGKYRLEFADGGGRSYRLAITDLTWWAYHDQQVRQGRTADQIAALLSYQLRRREVYLRIGLARGWEKFPERCFVQITGVYTFPDHLDGATFADLVG